MDTTNCLNDFCLICNWPQMWLSFLALPADLGSAVGSRLGIHPAGSLQAPVSMAVPEGPVGVLVITSSNKFCLIYGVKHPCHHFIPPSFMFFSPSLLIFMPAVAISHKDTFSDIGTGLLIFSTLCYFKTSKYDHCEDTTLCPKQLCLSASMASPPWSKSTLSGLVAFWLQNCSGLCSSPHCVPPTECLGLTASRSRNRLIESPPGFTCFFLLPWHVLFGKNQSLEAKKSSKKLLGNKWMTLCWVPKILHGLFCRRHKPQCRRWNRSCLIQATFGWLDIWT